MALPCEELTEDGLKRSIQVFDAAGDAVHKVHLKPGSDVAVFDRMIADLRLAAQENSLTLAPRAAVEGARSDTGRADVLRAEWDKMTDTHQFLKLVRKLKMNRLGAYRVVGAPYVRALDPGALTLALQGAARGGDPRDDLRRQCGLHPDPRWTHREDRVHGAVDQCDGPALQPASAG